MYIYTLVITDSFDRKFAYSYRTEEAARQSARELTMFGDTYSIFRTWLD